MAAVTGSWHSLHLGMMSKYDIAAFCKKNKNKSSFGHSNPPRASAAAACEYHAPPIRLRCNLDLILVFAATSILLFLPLDPWIPFVSTGSPFFAGSHLFCCSTLLSFIYFSLFIPFHLFCSQSICLHVSSVSLLSKYSCQLLH